MGAAGLQGVFVRKRWRASTLQDPTATPAPDLVGRNFKVGEPNRLRVGDISRIPTGAGPGMAGQRPRCVLTADRGLEGERRADTDLRRRRPAPSDPVLAKRRPTTRLPVPSSEASRGSDQARRAYRSRR